MSIYNEIKMLLEDGPSKLFLALCVAASFGATANAAATYSTEDEGATLVVDVDSDGATMDAAQVTSDITKIKKTGPGTLTAVPLSSYTGDFSIEEGVYSFDVVGDFGVTNDNGGAGVIDIKENAKILHRQNTSSPTTAQTYVLSGKTINLYGGTGANIETSTKTYPLPMGKKMRIVLKADASIKQLIGGRPSYSGTVYLDGHTLTLDGTGQFLLTGIVTNAIDSAMDGGKIVCKIPLMTDYGLEFDAEHTGVVELPSGKSWYINTVTANGWKIQGVKGNIMANKEVADGYDGDSSAWEGPIELTGSTSRLSSYDGYKRKTVLNLKGVLSGSGALRVGPGWLNLHNPDIAYSGTVSVIGTSNTITNYGGLGVFNGAPCFTNSPSITFSQGARFGFMDDVASNVPELMFVGDSTQSIFGGSPDSRSTIAGIVKSDEGVLEVDSPVRVTGTTKVDGGTLRVPFRSFYGTPGLVETHVMPKSPEAAPDYNMNYIHENAWNGTDGKYNICHPWLDNYKEHLIFDEKGNSINGPSHGLKPMINTQTVDWSDGYTADHPGMRHGWWYRGYIWNHSDEPVTYTFWAGFTSETGIFFGEDHQILNFRCGKYSKLSDGVVERPPAALEFTLQPGATPIDVFVWGTGSSTWCYSLPSNGERYGLIFAPSAEVPAATLNEAIANFYDNASADSTNGVRTLLRQFAELKDTSDRGLFFTSDVYGENEEDKITEGQPVFDELKFAQGTVFDLDGNSLYNAKNITGSPVVTNAVVFGITNNWTICAADFPADDDTVQHPMTVDGKLVFAEDATFSIDDETAIARSQSGLVVATATGGIVGTPQLAPGHTKMWKLVVSEDGKEIKLYPGSGMFVILQ